ncbi:MAG: hypothetical protein WDW36_009362 [Sanguina aurantia]
MASQENRPTPVATCSGDSQPSTERSSHTPASTPSPMYELAEGDSSAPHATATATATPPSQQPTSQGSSSGKAGADVDASGINWGGLMEKSAAAKAALVEEQVLLYVGQIRDQILKEHPEAARQPKLLDALVAARIRGQPVSYDALMRSSVVDPRVVPNRNSREDIHETLKAVMGQYDEDDFEMGIKQVMIEAQIKAKMEAGGGKGKSYDEMLSAALFSSKPKPSRRMTALNIGDDPFTTEVMEEAVLMFGEGNSLKSAWRVQENLTQLSYTQMWALVREGHVERVRFYGPETRNVMVTLRASAPGGVRTEKVVVAPDPDLFDHLVTHGVTVEGHAVQESDRLLHSLMIQVMRYTFPFLFISGVFWLLHTWLLDPMPNSFRRQEFVKYRREILMVASKLNFRSPARTVNIDKQSPDFIAWDDINGIDAVKDEINEVIQFLKNPALLQRQGVARIGGVLLAGAPGTGKTLLAKSIAAESGVSMFTCSGTDFYDVYSGVGARRIRETFEKVRNNAPAILFVDEFDALGAARGQQSSGDESASIINELLVQMDGFEDNRGVVVLGATNRPGAIDSALVRPGRFDRIIYMPLPDAEGRAKILQVHARGKAVDPDINWRELSRAMAGFTGADCMGLMQRAARMAGRQGRERMEEEDIYAAMENKAMDTFQELTNVPQSGHDGEAPVGIPLSLRKAVAVFEGGKALMAYITPDFEEVARVSVCPNNVVTGYTLMVEDETKAVDAIMTRGDMESHMVVNLAGRCSEKLVMGESEVTGLGSPDLFHANMIAREMILTMGMGRKMGPVDLMHFVDPDQDGVIGREEGETSEPYYNASEMSVEQSRVALAEVIELLEAAEAKAYYGLAMNWKPLNALITALLERGTVNEDPSRQPVQRTASASAFRDASAGAEPRGDGAQLRQRELNYPFKPKRSPGSSEGGSSGSGGGSPGPSSPPSPDQAPSLTGLASKTWGAGTADDPPRDKGQDDGMPLVEASFFRRPTPVTPLCVSPSPDGKFSDGWHYNTPYSMKKRELPEWYTKEVQRYSY